MEGYPQPVTSSISMDSKASSSILSSGGSSSSMQSQEQNPKQQHQSELQQPPPDDAFSPISSETVYTKGSLFSVSTASSASFSGRSVPVFTDVESYGDSFGGLVDGGEGTKQRRSWFRRCLKHESGASNIPSLPTSTECEGLSVIGSTQQPGEAAVAPAESPQHQKQHIPHLMQWKQADIPTPIMGDKPAEIQGLHGDNSSFEPLPPYGMPEFAHPGCLSGPVAASNEKLGGQFSSEGRRLDWLEQRSAVDARWQPLTGSSHKAQPQYKLQLLEQQQAYQHQLLQKQQESPVQQSIGQGLWAQPWLWTRADLSPQESRGVPLAGHSRSYQGLTRSWTSCAGNECSSYGHGDSLHSSRGLMGTPRKEAVASASSEGERVATGHALLNSCTEPHHRGSFNQELANRRQDLESGKAASQEGISQVVATQMPKVSESGRREDIEASWGLDTAESGDASAQEGPVVEANVLRQHMGLLPTVVANTAAAVGPPFSDRKVCVFPQRSVGNTTNKPQWASTKPIWASGFPVAQGQHYQQQYQHHYQGLHYQERHQQQHQQRLLEQRLLEQQHEPEQERQNDHPMKRNEHQGRKCELNEGEQRQGQEEEQEKPAVPQEPTLKAALLQGEAPQQQQRQLLISRAPVSELQSSGCQAVGVVDGTMVETGWVPVNRGDIGGHQGPFSAAASKETLIASWTPEAVQQGDEICSREAAEAQRVLLQRLLQEQLPLQQVQQQLPLEEQRMIPRQGSNRVPIAQMEQASSICPRSEGRVLLGTVRQGIETECSKQQNACEPQLNAATASIMKSHREGDRVCQTQVSKADELQQGKDRAIAASRLFDTEAYIESRNTKGFASSRLPEASGAFEGSSWMATGGPTGRMVVNEADFPCMGSLAVGPSRCPVSTLSHFEAGETYPASAAGATLAGTSKGIIRAGAADHRLSERELVDLAGLMLSLQMRQDAENLSHTSEPSQVVRREATLAADANFNDGDGECQRGFKGSKGAADLLSGGQQATYTLIVNVPPNTTRQDLLTTFSAFGRVELTVVVCDKEHRHPNREWTATSGYGFVRFVTSAEAALAVQAAAMGTIRLRGSRIRATWARKDSLAKHTLPSSSFHGSPQGHRQAALAAERVSHITSNPPFPINGLHPLLSGSSSLLSHSLEPMLLHDHEDHEQHEHPQRGQQQQTTRRRRRHCRPNSDNTDDISTPNIHQPGL